MALQKAFDIVSYEVLLEKINHYGIRSEKRDWFSPFVINRKQYVLIKGLFSQTKVVRCGVPPLGFSFSNLHNNLMTNAVDIYIVHHFADSTNLLFGNECPSELSCVMNNKHYKLA